MSMYGKHTARPRLDCSNDPGRTRQSDKAACDINNIIKRFVREGFVTHIARQQPRFLDVSEVGDYRSALHQVRAAEEYFAALPAKLRARFGNDPARFLDEAGGLSRDELRELGLATLRQSDRERRRESDVVEAAPGGAASGTVTS